MTTVNKEFNSIGERLFFLRKNHDLSMQELASLLRIPIYDEQNKEIISYKAVAQSTINNIEKDINKPTSEIIIAICKFFDVSTDWFLTGKEYKPNKKKISFTESYSEKDKSKEDYDMQHYIYEIALNYVQSEEFTNNIAKKVKEEIKKEDSK
ncbi:helix-turn-helix transcriptional regulator [Paenibacillus polymyxa]|uniref:helix-turn-helix domain-containing protein n=1 Tax=Paenibacillus polymyxa TaxID=1406 RepID=UPI002AB41A78|nr:helix-turn-helix transcriptional regulator [Paenibacillus polymyxa]MDY8023405.1 helix-turn-helix transcriptional regulator [Paenibacillus polymyxa]